MCEEALKVVTLIFITGRGSAFHLRKKGIQVLFMIWRRDDKLVEPLKRACIS